MKRYMVTLERREREELAGITRKGSHQSQRVINALIPLNCDKGEFNGRQARGEAIAEILRISARKVDRVKKRFVEEGLEAALGGQRVPAGVHGGLQPALRGGAAQPGGRAPRGASRRGGAGPDPARAPCAQADEEPDDLLPEPRVPGDGTRQGASAARRGGDGVQGVRRLGDGAAGRSGVAGAAARARLGGGPGGGREDGSPARRRRSSAPGRPTSPPRTTPGGGRSSRKRPGSPRCEVAPGPARPGSHGRRNAVGQKGTSELWRKEAISTLR